MKDHDLIHELREANPVDSDDTEEWMRGEASKLLFQRIVTAGPVGESRSIRRRGPRLAPLAAAVVLLAGVAAVYVTTRQTTNPLSVGCYETLSLEANTAVLGLEAASDELSPAARCASQWQPAFGTTAPSNLVTCVVPEGGLGVFPNAQIADPGAACSSIGASGPSEGSYAGASAHQVRQWASDVGAAYEEGAGQSQCISQDRLREIVIDSYKRPGFSEWTVSFDGSTSNKRCASYSIDAMEGAVIILTDH